MSKDLNLVRVGWLCVATLTLAGCAGSAELSRDAMSVGIASNQLMYNTVLVNIAQIRCYPKRDKAGIIKKDRDGNILYNNVIPIDSRISAGQDVVNNTAGITTTVAAGGTHGIVVPTISLPYTHSTQEQVNSVPSSDAELLLALMALYHSHANDKIFRPGKPPLGTRCFSGSFNESTVWVDYSDVEQLSDIALDVLGAKGADPASIVPANIYKLRKDQSKNQSKALEDAPATSIRAL